MHLKINRYLLFLTLIIVCDLNVFYLIDTDIVPIQDINIVLKILFTIDVYIHTYKTKIKKTYRYVIVGAIILAVTSSVMAYVNYNQPFWMGILPQRRWIISLLMYFPLVTLIRQGRITVDRMIKLIDKINLIYFIVIFIQYILGSNIQLIYAQNNTRYGSLRLYVSTSYLTLSYFYHLGRIIEGKKVNRDDVFAIIICLVVYLFITKSRMAVIMLMITTILALLTMRFTGKKLVIFSLIIIALGIFVNSGYGQQVMDSIVGNTANQTSGIREIGRKFYVQRIFSNISNILFGCGYTNINWRTTVVDIRYEEGIFAVDNGIFGLLFYYGFSFLLWLVPSSIQICKNAWKYSNKGLMFYMISGLLGMYTLYPFNYVTDITFALVLAFSDNT